MGFAAPGTRTPQRGAPPPTSTQAAPAPTGPGGVQYRNPEAGWYSGITGQLDNGASTAQVQHDLYNRRFQELGGQGWDMDPNAFFLGGNENYANRANQNLQDLSSSMLAGRDSIFTGESTLVPKFDQANGYLQGAGAAGLGATNQANLMAGQAGQIAGMTGNIAGQAGNIAGAAGGAITAGQGLLALGLNPQVGPSAAELAMRQTADQNIAGQAALAAGARGGNAGLALQNAAANQAQIGGNLQAQIGVQRAAEDVTNRQLQQEALSRAAGAYGQGGTTYGLAGQVYGLAGENAGLAGDTYGKAGDLFLGTGQLGLGAGELAAKDAIADAEARRLALDDTYRHGLAFNLAGKSYLDTQLGANMDFANNTARHNLDWYTAKMGAPRAPDYATGSKFGDMLLGTTLETGSSVLGTIYGGPAGGAGGYAAGSAANKAFGVKK